MPVKKRKLSPKNKPKPAAKSRPKNRYMRNAKLSEYKFLAILRGFADEKTPKELALTARVSEKTIRALYKQLRTHLIMAVIANPYDFGKAGYFIMEKNKVSKRGRAFFESVVESDIFKRYAKHQAPRTKDIDKLQDLIFDVTTRVFCHIALDKDILISYPEGTTRAIQEWKDIAAFLAEGKNDKAFQEKYAVVYQRFHELTPKLKDLLHHEQLLSLKKQSKEHRYANDVLYNDLRRYLLKNPLEPLTTHN